MKDARSAIPTVLGRSAPKRTSAWSRFASGRSAILGSVLIAGVALAAVFADLSPFPPSATIPGHVLEAPNRTFLMGTDNLGRDQLSRIAHGGRVSLTVAVLVVLIAGTTGV